MSAPASPPDLAALDARARQRHARIAGHKGFAAAPRLAVIDEIGADVWPLAVELAQQDGALGVVLMPAAPAEAAIAAHLGPEWSIAHWDVYDGAAPALLDALGPEPAPPEGWSIHDITSPDDAEVREIAALNALCGVSPIPGVGLRGEFCPTHTCAVRDVAGRIRASATAQMMFPRTSAHHGIAFFGMICVDPQCRGLGLGRIITALTLARSHSVLGWRGVTAWVAADNAASIATVTRAGLCRTPGINAMIAMPGGARFTR